MSKMAKLLYLWAILGCGVAWAQPTMDIAKRGLALGSQVPLYSFRMSSGVYVGKVDSYTVLDLNLTYQGP